MKLYSSSYQKDSQLHLFLTSYSWVDRYHMQNRTKLTDGGGGRPVSSCYRSGQQADVSWCHGDDGWWGWGGWRRNLLIAKSCGKAMPNTLTHTFFLSLSPTHTHTYIYMYKFLYLHSFLNLCILIVVSIYLFIYIESFLYLYPLSMSVIYIFFDVYVP